MNALMNIFNSLSHVWWGVLILIFVGIMIPVLLKRLFKNRGVIIASVKKVSDNRGVIFITSLIIGVFLIIGPFLFIFSLTLGWFLEALIVIALLCLSLALIFLLIYCWLAPNNICFTFVKEGKGKIIIKGGQFKKAIINWKDHEVDSDGKVKHSGVSHKRFFGGLFFYGWFPLDDVYIYDFMWTGVDENGELSPHDQETLDYVLLMDDVYGCEIIAAEDIDLLPLDLSFAITARVEDLYKSTYAVQNWYETMITRIRPHLRDAVSGDTYEKMIQNKTNIDKAILKRLKKEGLITDLQNRYGIQILKIEVKDINPSRMTAENPFRTATLKKYMAEKTAQETIILAEAQKTARASEGIDLVFNHLEVFTGLSKPEIQQWLKEIPGGIEVLLTVSLRLAEYMADSKNKAIVHAKVTGPGSNSLAGILAPLLALLPKSQQTV